MSIPDLRDEPAVRAEALADVLVEAEPVRVLRIVFPAHVRGVAAQALAGPFIREIRTSGRLAGAIEPLPGDRVAAVRTPLKVRTDDAIVPL